MKVIPKYVEKNKKNNKKQVIDFIEWKKRKEASEKAREIIDKLKKLT